jgi:protein-S-isoprenylcysteine O-methyltransferase Ste14
MQFPLGVAAFLAAMVGPRLPESVTGPARWVGVTLLAAGGLLFLAGLRGLGRQLTPFPRPRADATLVETGAFGLVRHPLYGGGTLMMLGWGLVNGRWSGLLATLVVGVFFDRKASVEERLLSQLFAAYPDYRRRVRKLIPWLY